MAAVEVARPNETAYIMESFLGVFKSYRSVYQGSRFRGRWGPPPIANLQPQVLHNLLHELTLLQLESCVVLLADRKKLTQEDWVIRRHTSSVCASIWAPRDMSSCTLVLRRRMDRILFISS